MPEEGLLDPEEKQKILEAAAEATKGAIHLTETPKRVGHGRKASRTVGKKDTLSPTGG